MTGSFLTLPLPSASSSFAFSAPVTCHSQSRAGKKQIPSNLASVKMHSCHSCKSHQNVVLIFLGCGGKWRLGNHTVLPHYWEEGQLLHFALFQHRPMFHHWAKSILRTNEKDHTLMHCLHCLLHSFFYHHGLWADAEINLRLLHLHGFANLLL